MLRAFVTVADHGGFAAAARQLGLSTSALTRHVAALEDDLGARLLRRTTRAVSLTDEGARFLDPARRLLADYEEARAGLERGAAEPTGHLVVTAPLVFGRLHLAPLLGRYALRHPRLTVELLLSDRNERLVEAGIDAALRIGHLEDTSDIAVRVGAVRRVLVAAPDYLAGAPPIARPEDLAAHRLIAFQPLAPRNRWNFQGPGGATSLALPPAFATDSADVAIGHACSGGGLTLALSYQVAGHLAAGRLVRLLADFEPPALPVQVVTRERRMMPAKLRGLLDTIRQEAEWDLL